LTTGLDAWRRVQEVNLTSVYLCCRAVLPHMQRRGRGSIINTASFVAVMGWPSWRQRRCPFITASTFLVDGGISGAYVTPL
jgi:NAD(P)-dependent dehydrogenase (short-subunit alcohol dehydrogenase family)